MKPDHKSAIPFLLAGVGLIACVALGTKDPKPSKPQLPSVAVQRPKTSGVIKPPAAPQKAEADAGTAAAAPGRVVLITVDGWHAKLTDNMPVWKEMTAEGAWTLRAHVPKGATTVNSHAELYTGAEPKVNGIMREPRKEEMSTSSIHGVATRWIKAPLKVTDTIFTATEAAGHKATAVVQKGKLVVLLRPDNVETDIRVTGDSGLLKTACKAVNDDAVRLVVLHIAAPDGAGHRHGWFSPEYLQTAETVSAQLQAIRKCIAESGSAVPTTLIVTSDHGGTPVDVCQKRRGKDRCGHGADDDDNRRVPWVAIGPGIKPGHQIAADIRLADTAPTLLRILGIPASSIPTLTGVSIDEIFVRP